MRYLDESGESECFVNDVSPSSQVHSLLSATAALQRNATANPSNNGIESVEEDFSQSDSALERNSNVDISMENVDVSTEVAAFQLPAIFTNEVSGIIIL